MRGYIDPVFENSKSHDSNASLGTVIDRLGEPNTTLMKHEAAHSRDKGLFEKDVISEMDYIKTKTN